MGVTAVHTFRATPRGRPRAVAPFTQPVKVAAAPAPAPPPEHPAERAHTSDPTAIAPVPSTGDAPSAPLHDLRTEPDADYIPSALLEQSPLPVSAPDERVLTDTASTGQPLTIRLLIDAQGQVRAVLPQDVHPDDRPFFERLQAMFLATSFLPGRMEGRDVPTRLDLVIQSTPSEVQDLSGLSEILAAPPAPPAAPSNP